MQISDIPSDVQNQFFDSEIKSVKTLSGGLLNQSYSASLQDGNKIVLQKINPLIASSKYDNYHAAYEHLNAVGWNIPSMINPASSKSGVVFADNNGDRWCAFTQLTNSKWDNDPKSVGRLLGKLHKDLSTLEYTPLGEILIVESDLRVSRLLEVKDSLPSEDAKKLANNLLEKFGQVDSLPQAKEQLIHADCKIDNILFEDGVPYTFIGWKTLMQGNIWFDIGDMMRSIAKTQHTLNSKISCKDISEFMESYHAINDLGIGYQEFKQKALLSAQHVTIVLAIRYATDYQDGSDGYFAWDNKNFKSRFEHNQARAEQLKHIYNDLAKCLNS